MSDSLQFTCVNPEASVRSRVVNRFVKLSLHKWFKNVKDMKSVKRDFNNLWFPTKDFFYRLYPDIILRPEQIAGIDMEWVFFPNDKDAPLILYFHGGGYVVGGCDSHRTIAVRLARACRKRVLMVDYRLAPDNPFPAAVEDALTAYHWALDQFGANQIYFGGDSAGGGLALGSLLAAKDEGLPMPKGAFCFSPWLDLSLKSQSMVSNNPTDYMLGSGPVAEWAACYLNGADPHTPLASPIYGNLSGLPPLLLHASSSEMLRDDSLRFANLAQAAGVDCKVEIWRDQLHAFQIIPAMMPESEQSIERVAKFVS